MADKILIASGSKPGRIPIEGLDSPDVMDTNQVLTMSSLPKSVAVIGGGVIGVEFAQFLIGMGVEVTILEMTPNRFPVWTGRWRLPWKAYCHRRCQSCYQGHGEGHRRQERQKTVRYAIDDKLSECAVEKVIMAVGRKPDFSGLNIEQVGLACERGAIIVNNRMETNVPGIYAAGDVVGGVMLAHVASAEGECAVRNALGHDTHELQGRPFLHLHDTGSGLRRPDGREGQEDSDIQIGRFPLRGNGKALILNETEGMVKIISDKKFGEVLGVHIGPHATDMIAEAVLGMTMEMTAEELADAIHPHPTVSEAIMEAAMAMTGGAIHMP